jgi:hypothetical protein
MIREDSFFVTEMKYFYSVCSELEGILCREKKVTIDFYISPPQDTLLHPKEIQYRSGCVRFIVDFSWVWTQEAKYIECWPNTTSAWACWRRFDIPKERYGGVHPCYCEPAVHWGLLPASRLASRKYLLSKISKSVYDQYLVYI